MPRLFHTAQRKGPASIGGSIPIGATATMTTHQITDAEAEELSPKEVEAQEAFTQLRDEILNLSDDLEVNEVLSIIDNHTPEWV
jgi:hypothetical protein